MRFKVGDRVIGHAVGMDQRSNKSSEGAFQEYTVIRTSLASPIPDSMSYESACVLPSACLRPPADCL
jgi:NADPH:quinone reductase-like Zn-dependent oxidoreductase